MEFSHVTIERWYVEQTLEYRIAIAIRVLINETFGVWVTDVGKLACEAGQITLRLDSSMIFPVLLHHALDLQQVGR